MEQNHRIHILGIAGTFMGGIAQIAKAKGFEVTGSDKAIYPPMSYQLEQAGIKVVEYDTDKFLSTPPSCVVIGNALSRGHSLVENTLNAQQVYTSGPQWLAENVLCDRWVVAVAGTHGKTSTASMVAWILEFADLNPGFLIGGVPENFGVSARLGHSPFFVVEADEYDTAFFDKRSKFVHYHPRTCVLNNLEFDHADIFDNLEAIQKQFHHLVRTVPNNGLIVMPSDDDNLDKVIKQGCWTSIETQGEDKAESVWHYDLVEEDGSSFRVFYHGKELGMVQWDLTGLHNVRNALSAIAAGVNCGVPPVMAVEALSSFKGIKRRMTRVGETDEGIVIYDDFAHHPTAIKTTLSGAKKALNRIKITRCGSAGVRKNGRLIAVFEPRSNTMRMGIHQNKLAKAFIDADEVYAFIDKDWGWELSTEDFHQKVIKKSSYDDLLVELQINLQPNDTVIIMSNGSFGGLHQRLFKALQGKN